MSEPDKTVRKATLMVPRDGYRGRDYAVRGTLRGHEGEWFRAIKGRDNHRVVRVGSDGLAEDRSYRVRVSDFIPHATEESDTKVSNAPEISQVGQRGAIYLSASFRARYGIREGGVVLQEPTDKGILIRPADVVPREVTYELDALLSRVTPENIHDEVSTGSPVGEEAW